MMYIGVDLGGTGIKAGVVNEQGEILSKGSTPTMKERPYQDIIHDIATLCKDVAQQAGITMDDVAAIGVGVPGICDAKTGIIPFCTNLAGTRCRSYPKCASISTCRLSWIMMRRSRAMQSLLRA